MGGSTLLKALLEEFAGWAQGVLGLQGRAFPRQAWALRGWMVTTAGFTYVAVFAGPIHALGA